MHALSPQTAGYELKSRSSAAATFTFGFIFVAYCVVAIWAVLTIEPNFDYRDFYMQFWASVLDGQSPWSGTGESLYPPLFQYLAIFYGIHPLFPKLLFGLAACVTVGLILGSAWLRGPRGWRQTALLWLVTLVNPYILYFGYTLGTFDMLVTLFILLTLICDSREKYTTAGILLGIATMLKVYPIFLFPLFVLENTGFKVRTRFLKGFVATCLVSAIPALVLWGGEVLAVLERSAHSNAEILSLFAFLTQFPPLQQSTGTWLNHHVWVMNAVTVIAWLSMLGLARKCQLPKTIAAAVTMIMVFAFYHVGHVQFLAVVVVLFLYGISGVEGLDRVLTRSVVFWLYFVWLQAVFLFYGCGYSGIGTNYVFRVDTVNAVMHRDLVGLPHFLASVTAVSVLVWRGYKWRRQQETDMEWEQTDDLRSTVLSAP